MSLISSSNRSDHRYYLIARSYTVLPINRSNDESEIITLPVHWTVASRHPTSTSNQTSKPTSNYTQQFSNHLRHCERLITRKISLPLYFHNNLQANCCVVLNLQSCPQSTKARLFLYLYWGIRHKQRPSTAITVQITWSACGCRYGRSIPTWCRLQQLRGVDGSTLLNTRGDDASLHCTAITIPYHSRMTPSDGDRIVKVKPFYLHAVAASQCIIERLFKFGRWEMGDRANAQLTAHADSNKLKRNCRRYRSNRSPAVF